MPTEPDQLRHCDEAVGMLVRGNAEQQIQAVRDLRALADTGVTPAVREIAANALLAMLPLSSPH